MDSVYTSMDTVMLLINHEDYYIEWRKMKEEDERQRMLKKKDDDFIEYLFVIPTGNWSGKDRAILYLIKSDSLIDIKYQ